MQLGQAQRRFDQTVAVPPQPGVRVEPVLRQQRPTVFGHEVHRLDDVVEHRVGDEVVEADPYPAGLDPLAAGDDLLLEPV